MSGFEKKTKGILGLDRLYCVTNYVYLINNIILLSFLETHFISKTWTVTSTDAIGTKDKTI